ncbi:hypothetical protein [Abyssalbus ytuae]|uniref:Uncharacterized protein n=1 Tax=Abyssalbus ytuae TaxID=2926907 RepID=A0A9E6ZVL6_9FLAO|nr:hypothetical protein [Abyssalbus ytuae]UOB17611.1 hypothetical protein MQE35_17960 [Abyssalbus ytuae]
MLKKINFTPVLFCLLLFVTSCEKENQEFETNSSDLPAEIEALLGTFTQKRIASEEEMIKFNEFKANTKSNLAAAVGCSLDSDAGCSSESTAEFLHYVQNCVTYPTPPFGLLNITHTYAGISYYVDGDTDVNCDNYEDDLQAMIDQVISVTGPAYNIIPTVYHVSPCNERSSNNFIIFDLEIWLP